MTDNDNQNPLTHTTDSGDVQMVDITEKQQSVRRATAEGTLTLQPSTIDAITTDDIGKGDILSTVRIGAVQAVKHTWETIPLCHQIPITNVDTTVELGDETLTLTVTVETIGQTGCEMEALQGVATGLNTAWDMVKAAEKTSDGTYPTTAIDSIHVIDRTVEPLE